MRTNQAMILQLSACLCFMISFTSGLRMPFLEKHISNEDIFLRLEDVQAKTQPEELKHNNVSFSGKKIKETLTLDQRCNLGLALSVRWTNYGPYGSLVRGTNRTFEDGVGLAGIFPRVINKVLSECCHENTSVVFGNYINNLKDLEKSLSQKDSPSDLVFPVGLQSMDLDRFKELPVVPLLVAPRTTLLVPESEKQGKTLMLFETVISAWPILAFIFLAAIVSGVFIWVLDHIRNPNEFPKKFAEGVWEGFWWAVVTMTTVGYGDRVPRSILGRLFCIVWIVTGMGIIAIFTAMVTACLSASIQNHFVIHGSNMASVDGSQEERIGTGMNADVRTFRTPKDVIETLVEKNRFPDLEVAIMDSYLLTYFHEVIKREPVRVKANLEQAINYGLVLADNSENFTKCFTRYIRNNPQDIFNGIRKNLKPLKNPTDDVSEELIASQGFLREELFHTILYALAGFLGGFFLLGLIWEFTISRLMRTRPHIRKSTDNEKKEDFRHSLVGHWPAQGPILNGKDLGQLELIGQKTIKIRQLIREFDDFYEKWMEKLNEATGNEKDDFGKDQNGSLLIVKYNGKYGSQF